MHAGGRFAIGLLRFRKSALGHCGGGEAHLIVNRGRIVQPGLGLAIFPSWVERCFGVLAQLAGGVATEDRRDQDHGDVDEAADALEHQHDPEPERVLSCTHDVKAKRNGDAERKQEDRIEDVSKQGLHDRPIRLLSRFVQLCGDRVFRRAPVS